MVGMSSSNHDGVPTDLGLSPLGTLNQQAFGAPEALDPLSIDAKAISQQHHVDARVAVAGVFDRQGPDADS